MRHYIPVPLRAPVACSCGRTFQPPQKGPIAQRCPECRASKSKAQGAARLLKATDPATLEPIEAKRIGNIFGRASKKALRRGGARW